MDPDSQFHLVEVTQHRRRRASAEQGVSSAPEKPRQDSDGARATVSHSSDRSRTAGGSAHHSHHHPAKDYGSVNLGVLPSGARRSAESAASPEPHSQGQLQREFLDKYAPVLNRKYVTSGKNKLIRILLIVGLVLLAGILTFVLATSQPDPVVTETIATVEQLPEVDVNDLVD